MTRSNFVTLAAFRPDTGLEISDVLRVTDPRSGFGGLAITLHVSRCFVTLLFKLPGSRFTLHVPHSGTWGVVRIGVVVPTVVGCWWMKNIYHMTESAPEKSAPTELPVRDADAVPTPKAEAKAANKLPRREQLNEFEKDLETKDSGNRPA